MQTGFFGKMTCLPLSLPKVRRRLVHEIQKNFFADLEIAISVSADLIAPITERRYFSSFSEIFLQSEYDQPFNHLPLPDRWLDIGCHAGFFSLYTILLRERSGLKSSVSALLIDGDDRTRTQVERLITLNKMCEQFTYRSGAIASSSVERVSFHQGDCMESHAAHDDKLARTTATVKQDEIMSLLPPPYDLVKIDIEGAEFDFLSCYGEILAATRSLIIEWHDWHTGGGGRPQIIEMIAEHGFSIRHEQHIDNQRRGKCGVLTCVSDRSF